MTRWYGLERSRTNVVRGDTIEHEFKTTTMTMNRIHQLLETKLDKIESMKERIIAEIRTVQERQETRVKALQFNREKLLHTKSKESVHAYLPSRTWLLPFVLIFIILLYLFSLGHKTYQRLLHADSLWGMNKTYKMT